MSETSFTFSVEGTFTREERREGAVLVARNAPVFIRRRRQAQLGIFVFMLVFTVIFYQDMRDSVWWIPIFLGMVLYFFFAHVFPGALQMMPSYPRTYQAYRFEWNDSGISRTSQAGKCDHFNWDRDNQSYLLTKEFLVLFLTQTYSMYIPKRFFSDEQWQALPEAAAQRLRKRRETRAYVWIRAALILAIPALIIWLFMR